jgi:hypothetical protein
MEQQEYLTADRQAEEQRLLAQGEMLDPLTRRLLASAGLSRGMRLHVRRLDHRVTRYPGRPTA